MRLFPFQAAATDVPKAAAPTKPANGLEALRKPRGALVEPRPTFTAGGEGALTSDLKSTGPFPRLN